MIDKFQINPHEWLLLVNHLYGIRSKYIIRIWEKAQNFQPIWGSPANVEQIGRNRAACRGLAWDHRKSHPALFPYQFEFTQWKFSWLYFCKSLKSFCQTTICLGRNNWEPNRLMSNDRRGGCRHILGKSCTWVWFKTGSWFWDMPTDMHAITDNPGEHIQVDILASGPIQDYSVWLFYYLCQTIYGRSLLKRGLPGSF
jgi:hypothetical protein